MITNWEKFEENSTLYLIENFNNLAQFIHQGGSDSTVADIKVITNKNKTFFMEAKSSQAQCGQFVLIPNDEIKQFMYSNLNQSSLNDFSQEIINYMNNNYETFVNSGTSGTIIELNKSIFVSWIKNYYTQKGVKFIITALENNFIIFPLESFENYFNVTAKYRVKKSGSSSPSTSNKDDIIRTLVNNGYNIEESQISISKDDAILTNCHFDLDKKKIKGVKYTYYFIKIETNKYRIRKLSNTNNANVIFSIDLIHNQIAEDLENFINYLSN